MMVTVVKLQFLYIDCPLPSSRQHSSHGDCLEVKREYYLTGLIVPEIDDNVLNGTLSNQPYIDCNKTPDSDYIMNECLFYFIAAFILL